VRQIDQAADVPGRRVAGRRDVDAGRQVRILIDGDAAPGAVGRRCNILGAAAGRNVLIAAAVGPGEHHGQAGAG
jgi:hypothetical protein